MTDSPEYRAIRAREVLENEVFIAAFEAVEAYIDAQALGCDPDDRDKAQRIVLSKQLLTSIKRNMESAIVDAEMAELRIAQIEPKRGLLQKLRR